MEPARGDTRKVIRSATSSGLAGRPSGRPPSGTLRINTLGMAARQIIAPRLGRFHRAFPDVTLDIVVDDGRSDIVAGRFDAGIRVGARLEKDMIAVRLTPDVKMVAVASPGHWSPTTRTSASPRPCKVWASPVPLTASASTNTLPRGSSCRCAPTGRSHGQGCSSTTRTGLTRRRSWARSSIACWTVTWPGRPLKLEGPTRATTFSAPPAHPLLIGRRGSWGVPRVLRCGPDCGGVTALPAPTASSAQTRPNPGIRACRSRSAPAPSAAGTAPRRPCRRRGWLPASGAW